MIYTGELPFDTLIETPVLLVVLALAAYRITRLLVEDVVFEPVREFIWKRKPVSTKFGYLWTCYWCMGTWVSTFWFASWVIAPELVVVLSLILSISAIIGLISAWTER